MAVGATFRSRAENWRGSGAAQRYATAISWAWCYYATGFHRLLFCVAWVVMEGKGKKGNEIECPPCKYGGKKDEAEFTVCKCFEAVFDLVIQY